MDFTKLFELIIDASLINNFVFTRFHGLCIFFGVSKKMETALGMSVTFSTGRDGSIDAVAIPMESDVGDIVFRRR